MVVTRHYIIYAKEGLEDLVRTKLPVLANLARSTKGCCGIELHHDMDNRRRFVFIEKWESADAHKSAANPEASKFLAELIPSFDGRPEAAYCEYLTTI